MGLIMETEWVPRAPVTPLFNWLKLMQAQIKDYLSNIPEPAIWKIRQKSRWTDSLWAAGAGVLNLFPSVLFYCICHLVKAAIALSVGCAFLVLLMCVCSAFSKHSMHGCCFTSLSVNGAYSVCIRHYASVSADFMWSTIWSTFSWKPGNLYWPLIFLLWLTTAACHCCWL